MVEEVRVLDDIGERVLAIHVQDVDCEVCASAITLGPYVAKLEQYTILCFLCERRNQVV